MTEDNFSEGILVRKNGDTYEAKCLTQPMNTVLKCHVKGGEQRHAVEYLRHLMAQVGDDRDLPVFEEKGENEESNQ